MSIFFATDKGHMQTWWANSNQFKIIKKEHLKTLYQKHYILFFKPITIGQILYKLFKLHNFTLMKQGFIKRMDNKNRLC